MSSGCSILYIYTQNANLPFQTSLHHRPHHNQNTGYNSQYATRYPMPAPFVLHGRAVRGPDVSAGAGERQDIPPNREETLREGKCGRRSLGKENKAGKSNNGNSSANHCPWIDMGFHSSCAGLTKPIDTKMQPTPKETMQIAITPNRPEVGNNEGPLLPLGPTPTLYEMLSYFCAVPMRDISSLCCAYRSFCEEVVRHFELDNVALNMPLCTIADRAGFSQRISSWKLDAFSVRPMINLRESWAERNALDQARARKAAEHLFFLLIVEIRRKLNSVVARRRQRRKPGSSPYRPLAGWQENKILKKDLGIWGKDLSDWLWEQEARNLPDDDEELPEAHPGYNFDYDFDYDFDFDFRGTAGESSSAKIPKECVIEVRELDMIDWWDQEPLEASAGYELSEPGSEDMLRTDTMRETTAESIVDMVETDDDEMIVCSGEERSW